MGKVYLVGAGPGDAGLITIKGLEKLKQCDAVIYDRLATEELLDFVTPGCKKVYVGKEAGRHYKKQEEINEILIECARVHNIVVRLKGGDAFVFGRGGEEIEALEKYNIPYEVIPGVTSAVAVPECAGIPVTHRGISRSFHVITGHTKTSVGSPDYDYEILAKTEGTLVFLMGLSNLEEITGKLIEAGKSQNTPAAVISEGTTMRQNVVRGTLENIGENVRKKGVLSPAIIVIGDTAAYEYTYRSEDYKCVGITATNLLWKKLEMGFEGIGMKPVNLCKMEVVKTAQIKELEEALKDLGQYQWIIFTSQNAIRIFFEEIKQQKIDIRLLGNIKFAVLGSGTAQKLLEYGIRADFIPTQYTVSALAEEFIKVVKQRERVLIPRAVQGSPELIRTLDKNQIDYCDIPIYDVKGKRTKNIHYLEDMDYLVFVSASGVTAFFEELSRENLELPKKIKIACIGKITQRRLLQVYGKADIVAAVNDVEGLLRAVKEYEKILSER